MNLKKFLFTTIVTVSVMSSGTALAEEKTPTREKLDAMAKQVIIADLDIASMLESKEFLLQNFDKDGMAEILMQLKDLLKINAEMIDRVRRVM